MKMSRYLSALLAALCFCAAAHASVTPDSNLTVLRPVASAYTVQAGASHLRDTYLTPVKYTGWSVSLDYERFQSMKFSPENWIMRLQGNISVGAAENPSKSATMWSLDFTPSWAMMRRFKVDAAPGLAFAAGGIAKADLGVLYLARNSNNPASAKAAVTIGVTAMAVYNTNIGKLPVTLRYQPSLPVAGVFFAPDYDELYYEIWLGNHKNLCRCAWPGSYIDLENLITADLHFGSTSLRLGYRNRVFSTKAAGIVSRRVDHSFVIGISTEWLSLRSTGKRMPDGRIISAFY